jgi:hypothetical protein
MILALVLSRYEYKLVDTSGKPPKQLPQPDRNDIHQVCLSFYFIDFPNTNSIGSIFRPDRWANHVSFDTEKLWTKG